MQIVKKIGGFVAVVAILAILSSGIITKIGLFCAWYFQLNYTQPNVSVVGNIAVRVLTHLASFSLVGAVFAAAGRFNSKMMGALYAFISTILGFVFAYIVWKIEENLAEIIIVLSIISALALAFLIFCLVLNIKKEKRTNKDQD